MIYVPYNAKAVANFFLDLARSEGEPLSPMKLQKLVYFGHGWHLALKNEPLLNEQVEAWAFGPVIRSLYTHFKEFGDQPITRKATRPVQIPDLPYAKFRTTVPEIDKHPDPEKKQNEFTKALLKKIWQVHGRYTAIQLSNMTHEAGSPWSRVYEKYEGRIPKGTDIPTDWIRQYFLKLAA